MIIFIYGNTVIKLHGLLLSNNNNKVELAKLDEKELGLLMVTFSLILKQRK